MHSASREMCTDFSSSYAQFDPHWGVKIIMFKNISRVSPMVITPGAVSKNNRAEPTTVNIRKKNRTFPQVLMLEKTELLVILEFL